MKDFPVPFQPVETHLFTPKRRQSIWLGLVLHWHESYEVMEEMAHAALALGTLQGVENPNQLVPLGGKDLPLLHAVLARVPSEAREYPDVVDFPLEGSSDWPLQTSSISARETLAGWLLVQGANPWVKDETGSDALDWAMRTGARSVVRWLLDHPCCPPQEELQKRVDGSMGRQVPWLHLAAYHGRSKMIWDLVGRGWALDQRDKNGQTVLGWMNAIAPLQEFIPHFESLSTQEKSDLLKFWEQRAVKKLGSERFDSKKMKEAFVSASPLSADMERNAGNEQEMIRWLSNNPENKTYNFKGNLWTAHNPDSLASGRAFFKETWDWRGVQEKGVAKGTWSLPAAALWAVLRGKREADSLMEMFSVLKSVAEEWPSEKLDAWLDESIRPGLTNRGLVYWFVHYKDSARGYSYNQNRSAPLQKVMEWWKEKSTNCASRLSVDPPVAGFLAAHAACMALPSKQDSGWSTQMGQMWSPIFSALGECLKEEKNQGLWGCIGEVVARQFKLEISAKMVLFRAATACLKAPLGEGDSVETRKKVFSSLVWLMALSSSRYASTVENQEDKQMKLSMWGVLKETMEATPQVISVSLDTPCPFTKYEYDEVIKKGYKGSEEFPSCETWPSVLREMALSEKMSDLPVSEAPTRRHRM